MTRIGTLLLAALGAGCSAGEPLPDLHADYPREQYLVGSALDVSAELAAERARAELAKVFAVEILDRGFDLQTTRLRGDGRQREESAEWITGRQISSFAQTWLEGVEIAELRSRADGSYLALAVLPRSRAAAAMRADIRRLDEVTGAELRAADAGQDPLRRLAAVFRAREAQQQREAIERRLRVVELSARGAPSAYSLAALGQETRRQLRALPVSVEVGADPLGGLRESLLAALSEVGLEPSGDGELRLRADLQVLDLGQQQGWQYLRGLLRLSLTQGGRGGPRGQRDWSVKAAGRDRVAAEARLRQELSASLEQQLLPSLLEFAGRDLP